MNLVSAINGDCRAETIQRQCRAGIDTTRVDRQGLRELHISLWPLPGERPAMMLQRLDDVLRADKATVVKHDVFGSVSAAPGLRGCLKTLSGEPGWPVTWIEGASCSGGPVAGMQVLAISGTRVDTIFLDGSPAGRVFSDGWARHCLIGDVGPADLSSPRTAQSGQMYQRLEAILSQTGMVLSDLVRTWLFLDDILSWYGAFNAVRTEIFTQKNLFAEGVPASTGVGARNPAGAALSAGAWAVQPLEGPMQVREVLSPLQCPARRYGSCFSRAVELSTPAHRRLLISGTASIDANGGSAHIGDVKGQIQHTMKVVEAILASCGMGFGEVTRATVYLKNGHDTPLFEDWCAEHHTVLPAVVTQCDICRDELLFEIEVDALAARRGGEDYF